MNTTLRALSTALAAALITPSAFAATAAIPTVDFHGYLRAGVGVSGDGSEAEWQKNKLGRLGNESDTYGELELGSEVYKKMMSVSISTAWSAWSPMALTIMKPR